MQQLQEVFLYSNQKKYDGQRQTKCSNICNTRHECNECPTKQEFSLRLLK